MTTLLRLPRPRAWVAAFTAAMLALTAGVSVLLLPTAASAEGLEKVAAEFTVSPGQTLNKEYSKAMVNGAELRPDPDGCRNNPAIALTCAVHRIKLPQRVPGYFLRISTSWVAQGNEVGTSVPDIDTYLFAEPTAALDYNEVGGVSGADPEQIKVIDPKSDEYDLVIGVYAGAVEGYKLLVEYVNESSGPTPAPADIVLAARQAPFTKEATSPMTGATGQPVLYALVKQNPDACRNDPSKDVLCDVYRLKLNRNRTPEASNFVVITLEWEARNLTPDLVLAVAGLEANQDPNLDMFIWDSASHVLERGQVGGESSSMPERVAFTATQDEYDLVVQIASGANTNYTLRAFMSDEIFDRPFEFLDPVTGQPVTNPVSDGNGGFVSPINGAAVVAAPALPLALAPIDVDDQIAGIGLGTREQFDNEDLLALGRSDLRNTAITGKPPAAWVLWLALLVIPAAFFGSGVVIMRRRHNEAF